MGSRVVIDQQALATGYVHWKRTVPYSNVVQKNAQTICTGYKENIVILESGYFFNYLCHWNWFLLSLLIFILLLYFFFNSRGRVPLAGNSLRAEKSHWQVQKVTLAGPKSHTRAKMSHWSVIMSFVTFLAATKQLNEWYFPSVRLSVRPSVCDTFLTMFPSSYHHEIFRSCYQWQMWRPCKKSRSEVKGQGHRGHDPT